MKHRITLFSILFMLTTLGLYAQKTIEGKVIDSQGEPLIGVTIQVKGSTKHGTITDLDGMYSVKVPSESTVLTFSYLGYQTEEINTKGTNIVDVTLYESSQQLGEIEVIGYGKQSKVTVTGAISSVSTADLVKSPAPNVANILAGSLSGVSTIQFSGQPGADNPEIFVRGVSTLSTANSTPLILVDGVERELFNIDPNEIESISVLKDASATAVFGVRGANGVIIVTTRRGEEGPAKISVSSSFGIQQPTRLVEFADSYEWATYYNEAMRNDGKPDGFSPEAMEAFRTGSNPLIYPNTDWMKMLFKNTAPQSQHNVNISGGTRKVRYFTSLGYLSQDGMFKNYDSRYDGNFYYKRFNFRTNVDVNFSDDTVLGISLGGRNEERNSPNNGGDMNQLFRSIYWATPFSGSGIVDGKWIRKNSRYVPLGDNDGLAPYYGKGYINSGENVLNIDVDLEQNLKFITKGLKFKIKGSYNSEYTQTKTRATSIDNYTPWKVDDLTWVTDKPAEDVVLIKSGDEGILSYSEGYGRARNWYFEANLNYNRKFGVHQVSGLLLYNQSKKFYPSKFTDLPRGYIGFVGRVSYNYKTRYLADFNAGYNGSENFPEGNRFGFFPAFSAGWVMTEEAFMKNQKVIDYLKWRASYGIVGNDKQDENRFLFLTGQYETTSGYYFGSSTGAIKPGIQESKLGNTNVTWEKAYKQNYGFDLGILESRLMMNFDYFIENRKDILTTPSASIPGYIGIEALPTLNLGKVKNQGMEITLKWNDKINDNFKYSVGTNISYTQNTIIFVDEPKTPYEYQWRTGRSIGQQFGKKFVGFYYDGMPSVADHGSILYPGDCVYEDINKDGIIDGRDDVAIGYPNYPLLNGGFNFSVTYKAFTISGLFAGATKTSRLLSETFRIPLGDTFSRSLLQSQFDSRWTPETANTATEPRPSLVSYANNFRNASDLWIRDASYLRLKNIEISMNINAPFVKKLGMSRLRVYMNGYNLFTIDKLKIADPETRTSDRPTYPAMRIFNMGVNANF